MYELTEKQQKVLAFIRSRYRADGYPPTIRDIAEHFGWASANSAMAHVKALHQKGRVEKTPRGYVEADNE